MVFLIGAVKTKTTVQNVNEMNSRLKVMLREVSKV